MTTREDLVIHIGCEEGMNRHHGQDQHLVRQFGGSYIAAPENQRTKSGQRGVGPVRGNYSRVLSVLSIGDKRGQAKIVGTCTRLDFEKIKLKATHMDTQHWDECSNLKLWEKLSNKTKPNKTELQKHPRHKSYGEERGS